MKYYAAEDNEGKVWGVLRVDLDAEPMVSEYYSRAAHSWIWHGSAAAELSGYSSSASAYREISEEEAMKIIKLWNEEDMVKKS